jgi:Protein of unknown function (DUF2934)
MQECLIIFYPRGGLCTAEAITNQEMTMSAPNTTEKKPKKAANKKTAGIEEKPPAAAAVRSKSAAPKAVSAKSNGETLISQLKRKSRHEEISSLAHRFFEQRGRQHGSHEQDWFRAERELADLDRI